MDLTLTGLRTLRAVAETGSFTAAAAALGYTQSAVSRQVAALERAAGTQLFDRTRNGVRLTAAGQTLLGRARVALDELDAAARELTADPDDEQPVRLGLYISGSIALLPEVLTRLASTDPLIRVRSREGTTPSLARALRSGSLDLAVLTSRPPHHPPDQELPRLHLETIDEMQLRLAVPRTGQFSGRSAVHIDELTDVPWIDSPASAGEPLLGIWPNLPGRPRVSHSARDWLAKLRLVAAGHGVTTIAPNLAPLLGPDIAMIRIEGVPPETRRLVLARLSGPIPAAAQATSSAVFAATTACRQTPRLPQPRISGSDG